MHGTSWAVRGPLAAAFVTFLAAFPSTPARAADAGGIDGDYSAGFLDANAVLAAAKAVTPERYPDADTVLVDADERVWYRTDGTSVSWEDAAIKVLTEKGKRELSSLSFGYHVSYTRFSLARLEILRPDGRIVPVDHAKLGREMIQPGQMQSNIYDPNQKALEVGIPGVEIGDIVRYVAHETEHKTRMPDTWGDLNIFEQTSPILHQSYRVHAPAGRPLQHHIVKSAVTGTVTYAAQPEPSGGGTVHCWEARDVPQFFPEPDMPSAYMVVQRLLVSTIPDWPTVSRWYWNLCKGPLEATSPEMKAKTEELTRGCTNDLQKAGALFGFVSQQVRYMGITTETEAPGYEPHNVSVTFGNRYGVCRDKAALLASMFRLAGLEGFPVLIYVGPRKDPEVPLPFFNHAIVAWRRAPGDFVLMDPTDETTRELLPAYLGNLSYLVATPEGETLHTSPFPPATENLLEVRTEASLDAAGRLNGRTAVQFHGVNDNAYRSSFARMKPEERRQFFEGMIKQVLPGARLTGLAVEPADMQDRDTPMRAQFAYEADDTLVRGDRAAMIAPPWFGGAMGMANFVLDSTGLDRRRFPLVTRYACAVRDSFTLRLDPALAKPVSLPGGEPLATDTLGWSQTIALTNGALTGLGELSLNVVEFSPEQYLDLKKALRTMEFDRRKRTIVEAPPVAPTPPAAAAPAAAARAGEEADVEILDHVTDYELESARAWRSTLSVRKRVLTYKGMKDSSEVKVGFNPAWETARVEAARVTMKGGAVRELNAKELNLMDAPWTGSAPRYPAEKTLVASLPGVEVGSVVEYRVVREARDRPFFSATEVFGGYDPVARRVVRVAAPAGVKLRIEDRTKGAVAFRTSEEDGRVVREWSATNLPPVRREKALPPAWAWEPTVFVSAGDWPAYGAEVQRALVAASGRAEAAAADAKKLTSMATNNAQRVRMIRDMVARRIRAAGPGLPDLPLSAVSPADVTLRDGYGNASDRAVLLHAMLAAAGLKPDFVLAGPDGRGPRLHAPMADAPQRGLFGQVLVRVRDDDGRGVLLNDTDQYADPGVSPSLGCDALIPASGAIERLDGDPVFENAGESECEIRLGEAGDARIRIRRVYRGMPAAEFRRSFSELPPEERRRYHQEQVSGVSQNATADGPLTTDFSTYPCVEEFAVRVERFAVRDGPRLYFPLPLDAIQLAGLGTDARANPIYWGSAQRMRRTVRIHAPEGFTGVAIAPPDLSWAAPGSAGAIRCSTRRPAGRASSAAPLMEIEQDVRLDPVFFEAAAYPALLQLQQQLMHRRMRTVMLEQAGAKP